MGEADDAASEPSKRLRTITPGFTETALPYGPGSGPVARYGAGAGAGTGTGYDLVFGAGARFDLLSGAGPDDDADDNQIVPAPVITAPAVVGKRRRGRPAGSPNKPKDPNALPREPQKRGRKAGSPNKPKDPNVPPKARKEYTYKDGTTAKSRAEAKANAKLGTTPAVAGPSSTGTLLPALGSGSGSGAGVGAGAGVEEMGGEEDAAGEYEDEGDSDEKNDGGDDNDAEFDDLLEAGWQAVFNGEEEGQEEEMEQPVDAEGWPIYDFDL
jgi:hypothetical protein